MFDFDCLIWYPFHSGAKFLFQALVDAWKEKGFDKEQMAQWSGAQWSTVEYLLTGRLLVGFSGASAWGCEMVEIC